MGKDPGGKYGILCFLIATLLTCSHFKNNTPEYSFYIKNLHLCFSLCLCHIILSLFEWKWKSGGKVGSAEEFKFHL